MDLSWWQILFLLVVVAGAGALWRTVHHRMIMEEINDIRIPDDTFDDKEDPKADVKGQE